jgi:hypothetical protein
MYAKFAIFRYDAQLEAHLSSLFSSCLQSELKFRIRPIVNHLLVLFLWQGDHTCNINGDVFEQV